MKTRHYFHGASILRMLVVVLTQLRTAAWSLQRGILLPALRPTVRPVTFLRAAERSPSSAAEQLPTPPTSLTVSPLPDARYAGHADFVQALRGLRGDPLQAEGTRVVIHRGNAKAKIMVIGEAPGETEDMEGKPFVGRAGKLLDAILASVGLDESSVYITNVVLRRPPNNRTPSASEVAWYLPYLMENVRLVDPLIILLAGACACKALLPLEKQGITRIRGQWFERRFGTEGGLDGQGSRLVMPIFHPSYLLRNPSRKVEGPKWLTWQDIQAVRRRYDELAGAGGGEGVWAPGKQGKEG